MLVSDHLSIYIKCYWVSKLKNVMPFSKVFKFWKTEITWCVVKLLVEL